MASLLSNEKRTVQSLLKKTRIERGEVAKDIEYLLSIHMLDLHFGWSCHW